MSSTCCLTCIFSYVCTQGILASTLSSKLTCANFTDLAWLLVRVNADHVQGTLMHIFCTLLTALLINMLPAAQPCFAAQHGDQLAYYF